MKTTEGFIARLCKFYEFGGKPAYNNVQIDEIADWAEMYLKSENSRVRLFNELKRKFEKRPLLTAIAETWNMCYVDEPEVIPMISEGSFDIFQRISAIREKQMKGLTPTPSEIDYIVRWSRLESVMGDLLKEGCIEDAVKIGDYIKNAIERGLTVPSINIEGKRDIMAYVDKVVRSVNVRKDKVAS